MSATVGMVIATAAHLSEGAGHVRTAVRLAARSVRVHELRADTPSRSQRKVGWVLIYPCPGPLIATSTGNAARSWLRGSFKPPGREPRASLPMTGRPRFSEAGGVSRLPPPSCATSSPGSSTSRGPVFLDQLTTLAARTARTLRPFRCLASACRTSCRYCISGIGWLERSRIGLAAVRRRRHRGRHAAARGGVLDSEHPHLDGVARRRSRGWRLPRLAPVAITRATPRPVKARP